MGRCSWLLLSTKKSFLVGIDIFREVVSIRSCIVPNVFCDVLKLSTLKSGLHCGFEVVLPTPNIKLGPECMSSSTFERGQVWLGKIYVSGLVSSLSCLCRSQL